MSREIPAQQVASCRATAGVLLLMLLAAAPLRGQAEGLPAWIVPDPAQKTVSLELEMRGDGPDGVATLNGHHHGDVQLVVPLGWTVHWTWVNGDSSANHSLVVMTEREKLPLEGGRAALENAYSRSLLPGLKPGQKDVTSFVADQAGWYWMLCGVPGHAIRGEWIGLKVDREATTVAVNRKE